MTAYHVAAFTVGTKDLPELSELLGDVPVVEPSPEEFHRRMRELGLE